MPAKPDPKPLPNEAFEFWFERQGFKHFTAGEFTSYFSLRRRGVRNSAPPRSLWPNIVPTLRIVDQLRDILGKPIVILSSYRSPAYNSAINGAASKSYHMQFMALDLAVAGHRPSEVFRLLQSWRTAKRFTGGLGLYDTFVHIDTRPTNATW
jgi:uncharacterized protein YcbK (DUF882 family)